MKTIPRNDMLTQIMERNMKADSDEFIRKCIERDKKSGAFDELVKRRQAFLDQQAAEKPDKE